MATRAAARPLRRHRKRAFGRRRYRSATPPAGIRPAGVSLAGGGAREPSGRDATRRDRDRPSDRLIITASAPRRPKSVRQIFSKFANQIDAAARAIPQAPRSGSQLGRPTPWLERRDGFNIQP